MSQVRGSNRTPIHTGCRAEEINMNNNKNINDNINKQLYKNFIHISLKFNVDRQSSTLQSIQKLADTQKFTNCKSRNNFKSVSVKNRPFIYLSKVYSRVFFIGFLGQLDLINL